MSLAKISCFIIIRSGTINLIIISELNPTEWGQGFNGYGFVDETVDDQFRFPEDMPETQK